MTARTWLLLHGTPLNPAVWTGVIPALTEQPVQAPDCTRVPEGADPQRQTARSILNEISGPLDVVGHSFGGQIALEVALAAPGRVRSLTILCSRDTPYPGFAATAAAVEDGAAVDIDATLSRWFSRDELAEGFDIIATARRCLQNASLPDYARALAAIAHYDSSARMPELAMPVSVRAAEHDAVSTPDIMRAMAQRIPNARFSANPDWFHMSPFVDPPHLAELLNEARARAE